jgi:hypothetical protein
VSGGLRRGGKIGHFPPRSVASVAQPGGNAGYFLWRGPILAGFGAKFALIRSNPTPITVRGLPSDGAAAPESPIGEISSLSPPAEGNPLAPRTTLHEDDRQSLHALKQAHTRLRVRYPRKGLEGRGHRRWPSAAAQGHRPCVAAEPPQSPVFCGAKNAPILHGLSSEYLLVHVSRDKAVVEAERRLFDKIGDC